MDVHLKKTYADSIPNDRFELLWRECIKSCMPILGSYGSGAHMFCVQKEVETDAIETIKPLWTHIANGKTVALKRRGVKKPAADNKSRRRCRDCGYYG